MPQSHMWAAAPVLDSTDTDRSVVVADGCVGQRCSRHQPVKVRCPEGLAAL